MNTKITTTLQIESLRKGDILKKFPINGTAVASMPDEQTENSESFDLRTINNEDAVLGVVMTRNTQKRFSSPGDISREFIRFSEVIRQGVWWLSKD